MSSISVEESLPNIKGKFGGIYSGSISNDENGCISNTGLKGSNCGTAGSQYTGTREKEINGSLSSPSYQDNAPVRPLSITTAFLIRY